MHELLPAESARIASLFAGWEETFVLSFLQGCMGNAWADNAVTPQSAKIVLGDFCLFAGKPDSALVAHLPAGRPVAPLILIAREAEWQALFQPAYPNGQFFTRYAFKKDPSVFRRERLARYAGALPPGYTLCRFGRQLYQTALQQEWSRDFCAQFGSWEQYREHGAGVAALWQGELASGASSYSYYRQGIEIEVDTKEEHRRKGLALACCAQLILDCLDQQRYPSWDAANLSSVHLAQRLGYQIESPYQAFLVPPAGLQGR